jgi:hypothetical protein
MAVKDCSGGFDDKIAIFFSSLFRKQSSVFQVGGCAENCFFEPGFFCGRYLFEKDGLIREHQAP